MCIRDRSYGTHQLHSAVRRLHLRLLWHVGRPLRLTLARRADAVFNGIFHRPDDLQRCLAAAIHPRAPGMALALADEAQAAEVAPDINNDMKNENTIL